MSFELKGTPPSGASVNSGTVSAHAALSAGDITINTIAVPASADGADAAAQTTNVINAINSVSYLTGVFAVQLSSVTFKLISGVDIVVAALAGNATTARTGLTAGTTAATDPIMDTRKQFGTNLTPSDDDVVQYGNGWMTVRDARKMGLIQTDAGVDVDTQAAQTPTRVDA